MSPRRRAWLQALAAGAAQACWPAGAEQRAQVPGRPPAAGEGVALPRLPGPGIADDAVRAGRTLVFPRDHGAHPGARIEWWYLTGWLLPGAPAQQLEPPGDTSRLLGWQLTFFRVRTGLAEGLPGRLAPRQLLFAHAAVSEIGARRHQHAECLARWNGEPDEQARQQASTRERRVQVAGWTLQPRAAHARGRDLALQLDWQPTQPLLLQGDAGFSRKGPQPAQASHYYSEPQLAVQARLRFTGGRTVSGAGRGWLDHEWSDEILHPQAVGWDWIGINLLDGSALTAFRLRRADGTALWAGGSFRAPGGAARSFGPQEVVFEPGRRWRSPATNGDYPVAWTVRTPAGTWQVQALLDAQEVDARRSTGTAYWEGLSALLDAQDRRAGLGYLEMTGYAGRLRL